MSFVGNLAGSRRRYLLSEAHGDGREMKCLQSEASMLIQQQALLSDIHRWERDESLP